eukprot:symbB.v1.2.006310.t1/scaffold354.1/size221495/5
MWSSFVAIRIMCSMWRRKTSSADGRMKASGSDWLSKSEGQKSGGKNMLPMYMTLPPIYETAAVLVAAFMAFAARTLYSTKDLPNQSSRISADDLTKQSLEPRMDDRSWEAAMSLAERASLHTAMAREMKAGRRFQRRLMRLHGLTW